MSDVWRPVANGTVLVDGLADLRIDGHHLYFSFDGDELYDFEFENKNRICELVSAEQPVAPQPDWTAAPEWAEWYSMDKDGNDHWWRNKPILNDKYAWWLYDWDCGNTTYPHYIDVRRRPEEYGIDWRQTLQRRPQKAP